MDKLNYNDLKTIAFTAKARSRPILNCGYPKNKTTTRHSNVRLKCIVALSGSLPDFRWIHWKTAPPSHEKPLDLKNGHFTVIDPIHYSTIDIGNKGQHGVVLNLKNVTDKDFGLYTCIASNHLGKDYRSAYLIKKKHKKHKIATVTTKGNAFFVSIRTLRTDWGKADASSSGSLYHLSKPSIAYSRPSLHDMSP